MVDEGIYVEDATGFHEEQEFAEHVGDVFYEHFADGVSKMLNVAIPG